MQPRQLNVLSSRRFHPLLDMRFRGRRILFVVGAGACLTLMAVSRADAQTTEWSDRAFLNVNMTLQMTSAPFDENLAPIIYAERAVLSASHPNDDSQPAFEPAGGIRIWKNLGVGAALTRRSLTETTNVRALVPHPVLFNQPRVASKDATFERSGFAVHPHALLMLPVHPRLDVALSAGPSFFHVRQDIIRTIEVAETGAPFVAVGITNVPVISREADTVGLNIGADVTWFLTQIAGIGVTTRYTRGYAATTSTDGSPLDLDVGGLQIGFGARLRFR
jgi:hypothetical protein